MNNLVTRHRSQNVLDLMCTWNPNIGNNIRIQPGISYYDNCLTSIWNEKDKTSLWVRFIVYIKRNQANWNSCQNSVRVHWICLISLDKVNAHLLTSNQKSKCFLLVFSLPYKTETRPWSKIVRVWVRTALCKPSITEECKVFTPFRAIWCIFRYRYVYCKKSTF